MDFITDFISQYGMVIVYAVLTAIAGFLGAQVKKIYEKTPRTTRSGRSPKRASRRSNSFTKGLKAPKS